MVKFPSSGQQDQNWTLCSNKNLAIWRATQQRHTLKQLSSWTGWHAQRPLSVVGNAKATCDQGTRSTTQIIEKACLVAQTRASGDTDPRHKGHRTSDHTDAGRREVETTNLRARKRSLIESAKGTAHMYQKLFS